MILTSLLRRVGAAVAAMLLALGGLLFAGASPAQAAPVGCPYHWVGHWEDGSQNIHAYNYWECIGRPDILQPISIQRFVSNGVWTTVASGTGYADYYCDGHALNIYKVYGEQLYDTCG